MKLSKEQFTTEIHSKLHYLRDHLSLRIHGLMEQTITDESLNAGDELELFDVLVNLILRADQQPASLMANLMVPLDTEGANSLDNWTISEVGAFIRDYLKKDYMSHILKSKDRYVKKHRAGSASSDKA